MTTVKPAVHKTAVQVFFPTLVLAQLDTILSQFPLSFSQTSSA